MLHQPRDIGVVFQYKYGLAQPVCPRSAAVEFQLPRPHGIVNRLIQQRQTELQTFDEFEIFTQPCANTGQGSIREPFCFFFAVRIGSGDSLLASATLAPVDTGNRPIPLNPTRAVSTHCLNA